MTERKYALQARTFAALLIGSIVAGSATAASAEWPMEKPVSIIVPATPGGMVDIPSRIAADVLARETGGTFVLDHRAGAGGTVGTQALLNAPADGYTFILISSAATIAPVLYPDTVGDPEEQFVPISLATEIPVAISVPFESPIDSLDTLIAMAEQNPNGLAYGSGGIGSGNHLTGERLAREAGIEMVHIPYGGVSAALTGMLSGEADMAFTSLTAAQAQAEGGLARIIAVGSSERLEDFPDIPTLAETFPGLVSVNWFGFVGAEGFPTEVRDQIQSILASSLDDGETFERGLNAGLTLQFSGPEPLAQYIRDDVPVNKDLLEELGIGAMQ